MYRAIVEIGGYKVGEEVPTEKAEVWLKAYEIPQVEKVDEESKKSSEDKTLGASKEKPKVDPMLDDYLGRNTNVVVKNIEEDDLNKKRLESLLELEKSDKKRKVVIKAIEKKLRKIGG